MGESYSVEAVLTAVIKPLAKHYNRQSVQSKAWKSVQPVFHRCLKKLVPCLNPC
ncbi:Uncharacterised protein [Streptococcus pyogenes]|nr:Uncharacterised protein [Streptococcus pyogenes]